MPEIPVNPLGQLAAGLVGFGMIVEETYRPFFDAAARSGLFHPATGAVVIRLVAAATRTGARVARYLRDAGVAPTAFSNLTGEDAAERTPRRRSP